VVDVEATWPGSSAVFRWLVAEWAPLLSLYFVLRLASCWLAARPLAGAFVYALLVNSNLYVRHLVPYDWALCAGLLALWLAVTRPTVRGLGLWTGLLTAATLTIYTGYYSFCAVIGVAIVWERWSSALRPDAVRAAIVFGASGALVVDREAIRRDDYRVKVFAIEPNR
jgi:hypothetical protein